MNCAHPIDGAVLADYWLGLLTAPDEEPLEEHLLTCDDCGARLREAIALAEGVRRLAAGGRLRVVLSDAFLQRARENGVHVREYRVTAGGSVMCTITEDDDLVVGRLAADLAGADRVDLSLFDGRGVEQLRLPDIPFSAGADEVIWQVPSPWLKSAPDMTLRVHLVAVDEAGVDRMLGEYTFNHTRSLPGPAAW